MHTILITGGCGFVGSNLAIQLKQKYSSYRIITFDNLKRRGSELNIKRLRAAGVEFIHGDIRNTEDFEEIPEISILIDACAEPSVLAGLDKTPNYLVHTNFNGTLNCLNFAAKHQASFIFLSTSRVYPINYLEQIKYKEGTTRFEIEAQQEIKGFSQQGISEAFPTEGYRSLYGATKLASELLITEFNQLLGLKTVINRCGVITGPYQMGKVDQGVIVLWAARHFWEGKLGYFGYGGKGKQVRDILHIDDLFRLIDFQIHNLETVNGKTMNAGGGLDCSISLAELTDICEQVIGNSIEIKAVPETRTADIPLYITDNSYVTELTGWHPQKTPTQIIEDVHEWLIANEQELKDILS
ncbi:MAG: NAD-dependent epimerase/dehydratase family protein [Saprospiraceae bacterium]